MPDLNSRASTIPGYNLVPPTEADALAALQRVWDQARGARAWADGCRDAGVVEGKVDSIPALERVVAALARQGGATATVARSIEIRMRTYARLAARANASNAGVVR